MTFEERIQRLTERHEALAQTLELMVIENKERDRRMAEADERIGAQTNKLNQRIDRLLEIAEKLLRIGEIHEHRLNRLEGK